MGFPETPQHLQDGGRQGHITILAALAVNVQAQTLSIDIADLQLHGLAQTQTTGIDGGKEDAVKGGLETIEQPADLLPAHHRWNFVFVLWSHQAENRPGALQGVLIEEFDGAEGNRGMGARDLALVGEEEKVLANLFLGQLLG